MDAIDSLPQGVVTFFVAYEYLALVALFFISEAGVPLPLPNFALILYASYLSGQGQGNLLLILLSVVVGMLAGSLVLYLAASRGGRPLLQKYGKSTSDSIRKGSSAPSRGSTGGAGWPSCSGISYPESDIRQSSLPECSKSAVVPFSPLRRYQRSCGPLSTSVWGLSSETRTLWSPAA